MKRFFFSLIALAAVAASCTQSALVETPDLFGTEVSFSPYTGRTPVTKATQIADADALNADGGFNILCYLNKDGEDPREYLNARVTKSGSAEIEIADNDMEKTIYSTSEAKPTLTGAYDGSTIPEGWTDDKVTESVWRALSEKDSDGVWSEWKISEILTGGYWDYPGTIYWPDSQSSSTLSFVAFSSNVYGPDYAIDTETEAEADRDDLIEWTKGTNDEDLIKFSVPEAVADQVDFLATSFLDGLSLNNTPSGMVNLYFKHLLSRVGFKLQANQDNNVQITISDVTLSGTMPTSGTLDIRNTSAPFLTSGNPDGASYSLMEGWSDFVVKSSKNPVQIINQASGANTDDCYMMIMPHTSTNDKINVTYQLQGAEEKQASVDLAGFNFVAGKAYEFVLKVSTSSIEFYVEESDWNNGTVNNSYPLVPGDGTVLRVNLSNDNSDAEVTITEPDNYDYVGMQRKADSDGTWTNVGSEQAYNGISYEFDTESILPGESSRRPNTTYYVRAYARKGTEKYYSVEIAALTTAPELNQPTVTFDGTSATLTCSLSSNNGNARIETVGFYCCKKGESYDPEKKLTANLDGKTFSYSISGLDPVTEYTFKAFATNAGGTGEASNEFKTTTIAPEVETKAAEAVQTTSATLSGIVNKIGGAELKEVGFMYGTDNNSLSNVLKATTANSFSQTLTASPNTKYYFKAYAKNEDKTGEGEVKSFTTLPSLNVVPVTEITGTTATFTCSLTDNNGSAQITANGFYYCKSSDEFGTTPVTVACQADGSFFVNITGLTPATEYKLKAFATNAGGTSETEEFRFTTLPVATTGAAANVQARSATLNGTFVGNDATTVGFMWGTSENQLTNKLEGTKTNNSSFSATLTTAPNTTYYFKAYAKNGEQTGEGEQASFTSLPEISIISGSYNAGTATIIAELPEDSGTAEILKVGYVRNGGNHTEVNAEPSGRTYTIVVPISSGTNTIKVYAENSTGKGYSSEITFTNSGTNDPIIDWGSGNGNGETIN